MIGKDVGLQWSRAAAADTGVGPLLRCHIAAQTWISAFARHSELSARSDRNSSQPGRTSSQSQVALIAFAGRMLESANAFF